MKRIASIFIALSLCTLPCFATAEQSTCPAENAKTAVLTEIGNTMVCVPEKCKCGYDLKENRCIKSETKKCTHSDPDAWTAHEVYEEINGECEPICRIKTCKTGFIKNDSDQCIKKTKDVSGKKIEELTKRTQDTKTKIKDDVEARFCKEEWLNFTDKCDEATPTVIAGCKEYIREARNELKNALKNYCFANKTNVVEIYDEKTNTKNLERAEKQEKTNKLKTACNKGSKGTWNDNKGKCTCNNREHIFDETEGCIAETTATTTAKSDLNALKLALDKALKTIKANQTQK